MTYILYFTDNLHIHIKTSYALDCIKIVTMLLTQVFTFIITSYYIILYFNYYAVTIFYSNTTFVSYSK